MKASEAIEKFATWEAVMQGFHPAVRNFVLYRQVQSQMQTGVRPRLLTLCVEAGMEMRYGQSQ